MSEAAPQLEDDDLALVWGGHVPDWRAPRVLGVFAHPDDEVFCAGGTLARCAQAGAVTAVLSLGALPAGPEPPAGRGPGAAVDMASRRAGAGPGVPDCEQHVVVEAGPAVARKAAALAAHRSQYALDLGLFPASVLDRLLGTECFVVVEPAAALQELQRRSVCEA